MWGSSQVPAANLFSNVRRCFRPVRHAFQSFAGWRCATRASVTHAPRRAAFPRCGSPGGDGRDPLPHFLAATSQVVFRQQRVDFPPHVSPPPHLLSDNVSRRIFLTGKRLLRSALWHGSTWRDLCQSIYPEVVQAEVRPKHFAPARNTPGLLKLLIGRCRPPCPERSSSGAGRSCS